MHLLCPNLVSGSWILRWTLLCLAVVVSMMGTTVAMLYDYHNSPNNHRPAVVRGHLGNHHRVHLHGPTTVVRAAYKKMSKQSKRLFKNTTVDPHALLMT